MLEYLVFFTNFYASPSYTKTHNMRTLLILAFVFISAPTVFSQIPNLNGTWIPLRQEFGGNALPGTVFEKQKLIINDTTYTLIAESIDKGQLQFRENKMDIFGKEGVNTGKHFTAIYKYENDELTICYNLKGDVYPENFETKSRPLLFLSVFKKIQ